MPRIQCLRRTLTAIGYKHADVLSNSPRKIPPSTNSFKTRLSFQSKFTVAMPVLRADHALPSTSIAFLGSSGKD